MSKASEWAVRYNAAAADWPMFKAIDMAGREVHIATLHPSGTLHHFATALLLTPETALKYATWLNRHLRRAHPMTHDRPLRDALQRLADAAELYMGNKPDASPLAIELAEAIVSARVLLRRG